MVKRRDIFTVVLSNPIMRLISYIFLLSCLILMSQLPYVEGSEWGPWDKNEIYVKGTSEPQQPAEEPSFFRKVTTFPPQLLITFFQKVISPVDGATCDFYPTCSAYAKHALEKHGLVIGLAMANERTNRYHSPEGYELIYKFDRYYIYDPVENNDFWFAREKD